MLKIFVNETKPSNLYELKNRITLGIRSISPEMCYHSNLFHKWAVETHRFLVKASSSQSLSMCEKWFQRLETKVFDKDIEHGKPRRSRRWTIGGFTWWRSISNAKNWNTIRTETKSLFKMCENSRTHSKTKPTSSHINCKRKTLKCNFKCHKCCLNVT